MEDTQQPTLTEEERKDMVWETNHDAISTAIRTLQRDRLKPTITRIADHTGLSRPTIYKHLNEFITHPVHKSDTKMPRFMLNEVIMKICEQALYGDIKACRLYCEIMGLVKTGQTINTNILNQHTNAIVVNGFTFTEEMVQRLSPDNLAQLEEFVKAAGAKSSDER